MKQSRHIDYTGGNYIQMYVDVFLFFIPPSNFINDTVHIILGQTHFDAG